MVLLLGERVSAARRVEAPGAEQGAEAHEAGFAFTESRLRSALAGQCQAPLPARPLRSPGLC